MAWMKSLFLVSCSLALGACAGGSSAPGPSASGVAPPEAAPVASPEAAPVAEEKAEEAGPTESRAPDFDLLAVLQETRRSFPAALRSDWLGEWSHARAYTYNFVRYGPGSGRLRVFDGEWNSVLRQVIGISKEQAEAALELTHRTAGEVRASKCAFPRHAVVFFDAADRPVASVNVCFSCTDVLVWPRYGTQEAQDSKHSDLERFTSVHDEVMERWQLFFDGLGADRYSEEEQEDPGRP